MHEGGACFADLSGEGFGSGLGGISMQLGMGVGSLSHEITLS